MRHVSDPKTPLTQTQTPPKTEFRFEGRFFYLALPPRETQGGCDRQILQGANLGCLQALGTFDNFKFDFLAFIQATIAATFDSREVSEHIRATCVRCDETKAFLGIEPLDFAFLSHDVKRPISNK